MHLAYPPKFCIAFVFDFPCGDCNYPVAIVHFPTELTFLKAAFKTFAEYCGGSGRLTGYSRKVSTSLSV